jgi:flagellar biosynthesis/type III secretory pathway protein FliH
VHLLTWKRVAFQSAPNWNNPTSSSDLDVRQTMAANYESHYKRLFSLTEGKREGRREGRLEGLAEGKRDGRLEGLTEGKREGILEGEARLLHRLLERRFGRLPLWVEERLAKATEEDLVRWGERTLDLGVSLQQLFGT